MYVSECIHRLRYRLLESLWTWGCVLACTGRWRERDRNPLMCCCSFTDGLAGVSKSPCPWYTPRVALYLKNKQAPSKPTIAGDNTQQMLMNTKRFAAPEEELCAGFHGTLTFCVSASPCHKVSLRDLSGVAMSWREILSLLMLPQHPRASQSQRWHRQRSLFWRSHTITAVR